MKSDSKLEACLLSSAVMYLIDVCCVRSVPSSCICVPQRSSWNYRLAVSECVRGLPFACFFFNACEFGQPLANWAYTNAVVGFLR